ncbi:MAG TPA: HAD family hydrolase, partial [Clostridia bacterium]|nr:HAD family hydrolase [Clostridia bacterium]
MIGAVIFDVYGTLLEVGPAPANADELWKQLWLEEVGSEPSLTRLSFSVACNHIIQREHALARSRGIPRPEVHWPLVVTEVVPALAKMPPAQQREFFLREIQTGHSTQLSGETAEVLRKLKAKGCLLGIASNAQAYTLEELGGALAAYDLGLDLFEPDLCFWSFQHGFSKPDPHVFQILTSRLVARGVGAEQTVMVGDRLDNDMEPARLFGWQTWHVVSHASGGWTGLLQMVSNSEAKMQSGMDSGTVSP